VFSGFGIAFRRGLIAAAVSTNAAVDLARQLEEQFLKDHPAEDDTMRGRQIYFGVQYLSQGEDPEARLHPGDLMNLMLYDIVNATFMNTHSLIDSFGGVLKVDQLPIYKEWFYGTYNPLQNR
jgi:hypothetical protein